MSVADLLILTLAALYVLELWWLLPDRAIVFEALGTKHFSWRLVVGRGLSVLDGRVLTHIAWLPLTRIFPVELADLRATQDGVEIGAGMRLPPAAPPPPARALNWTDASRIEADGTALRLDGEVLSRHCSASSARHAREWLNAKPTPGSDELTMLTPEEVRKRLERLASDTRGLRMLCTLMLALLFGALPAKLYGAWALGWQQMGLAYGVLLLAIGIEFVRVHRRWFPALSAQRWAKVAAMLVSPPQTVLAPHVIAREVGAAMDPMAAAAALCSKRKAEGLAEQVARGAMALPGPERHAMLERLRTLGFDPIALCRPPSQQEGSAAFCPRCLGQFAEAAATCSDCQTVPLVPFG